MRVIAAEKEKCYGSLLSIHRLFLLFSFFFHFTSIFLISFLTFCVFFFSSLPRPLVLYHFLYTISLLLNNPPDIFFPLFHLSFPITYFPRSSPPSPEYPSFFSIPSFFICQFLASFPSSFYLPSFMSSSHLSFLSPFSSPHLPLLVPSSSPTPSSSFTHPSFGVALSFLRPVIKGKVLSPSTFLMATCGVS